MKNLRHVCAAVMLALIISGSAFAGEMDTPGSAPPPPPPPTLPVTGEMDTPGRPGNNAPGDTGYTYDPVTEAALLFCRNVLSLL